MAPKKSRNKGTTTPQLDSSKGGGAKSTNSWVSRGRAAGAVAARAPQVKISSENEVRLRRLLHNTKGRIVSSSSSSALAAGAGQKRISLKPRKSKLEDVSGVYTILLSQRDFLLCKLSKLWQLFPW